MLFLLRSKPPLRPVSRASLVIKKTKQQENCAYFGIFGRCCMYTEYLSIQVDFTIKKQTTTTKGGGGGERERERGEREREREREDHNNVQHRELTPFHGVERYRALIITIIIITIIIYSEKEPVILDQHWGFHIEIDLRLRLCYSIGVAGCRKTERVGV